MGVSGSGKSTVGIALAQRLKVPFADADALHSQANIAKMATGAPLDDADRLPWLDAVGEWLIEHDAHGGVIGCSALKRSYRDRLRRHCGDVEFLHLTGEPDLIRRRQTHRHGHFMPATLMQSQLDTLEPLQPDENGITTDIERGCDSIVDCYLARHAPRPPSPR